MSFEDLRAFLAVAEHGSFLSAAVALGMSRTTLRRQVDALESRAGVLLLDRTRNGIELTEAGRKLVGGGYEMERGFTALLAAVREVGRQPRGQIRVVMQVGFPPGLIARLYAMLSESWPEVRFYGRFSDAPLEVNRSDVDVLIWLGTDGPGLSWRTYTVIPLRVRLFASASYLEAHGTPRTLEELRRHRLLAWRDPGEAEPRIMTPDGVADLDPALVTTDSDLLHACAQAGLGIVWAPDAQLPLADGQEPEIPVMDELVGHTTEIRMAMPQALADVPKFRVFLETLHFVRDLIPAIQPSGSVEPEKGG